MDVISVLQAYPATTSAGDAAAAISRAVRDSARGTLPGDAVNAARRALGALAQRAEPAAIGGLVDAVEAGARASGVDAFVLTASAWRTLAALANAVAAPRDAGRILGAAATSAAAVLRRDDAKKLRVARFHVANAARFAKAFTKNGVSVEGCPSATADLFGLLALESDAEVRKLCAPTALVLRVAFAGCDDWRAALCAPPAVGGKFEDVAPMRTMVAIYLARSARSAQERDKWNDVCEGKLASNIVPFLFHVLQTCGVRMLDVQQPSICAMILSSLRSLCDVCDTNLMLEYVASPSLLVSRAASMVLAERVKCGDKLIKGYVHECRLLSDALRSPLATQRWEPLERMISDDDSGNCRDRATLDHAAGLPLLRRVNVLAEAEKQARERSDKSLGEKIHRIRAGVSEGKGGDVQELARALTSDTVDLSYVNSETDRMEMVAKYARLLATSNESTARDTN